MKKPLNKIFNYVIEQDFNPDFVQLGLMDSYDAGKKIGLFFGVCVGFTLGYFLAQFTPLIVEREVENHERKN